MNKARKVCQFVSTALMNLNLKGLLKGSLYKGKSKGICVPGLNCYSCPAAVGSCPLGALQATLTSIRSGFNTYVAGTILLMSAVFGRIICGWVCPFGLIQELLYKFPGPKCRFALKKLGWVRYAVLAIFVLGIPLFTAYTRRIGVPGFCKYICPQGTIGGLALLATNKSLRGMVGLNFLWKVAVLLVIVLCSIWIFRPFCRVLCPLGMIYGLFNAIALVRIGVDGGKCNHCGRCDSACPVELKPETQCNASQCIRCGRCVKECPQHAIGFRFLGFKK